MVYRTFREVLSPLVRVIWVSGVEGLDNLPQEGGAIIAANHQSYLDAPLLMAISRRRLYFIVGDFVYRSRFAGWLMNRTGQIRVNRKNLGTNGHAYEQSVEVLKRGDLLCVFPEAWMSKDGKVRKADKGIARIALQAQADIVPIVLDGSYGIYPWNKKLPAFGKKCRVKILPAIKHEEIEHMTEAQIVHRLLMPTIAAELGHEYAFGHLAAERVR